MYVMILEKIFTGLAIFTLLCSGTVTIAQPEIKRDWTAFAQVKDASFLKKKVKFKLTASSKVNSADSTAHAGLWVRVESKEGEISFFDNMVDRPIRSNQWQAYTIEGEMDENSGTLSFGGICNGNGEFYFDDFVLMIQNDKGVMEKAMIENPGFELGMINSEIPSWVQGVSSDHPVRVQGFSFSASAERVQGSYSLLVGGKGIPMDSSSYIGPYKGFSTQIGTLVSMLNNLSSRVEGRVNMLNQKEVDHLMDSKANSIGALIMHLAASEAFVQVYTFENREFSEEEDAKWMTAIQLGDKARKEFVGHPVEYYLDIYRQVREKSIKELQKRNDEWLFEAKPGARSNYYFWFHVMEHQSSHLGQILLMKKRLPKREKPLPKQKLDTDH
jgi:Protein of unknown function (DUF664)